MNEYMIIATVVTEHGTDTRTDSLLADTWGEALCQAAAQVNHWAREAGVVITDIKISQ